MVSPENSNDDGVSGIEYHRQNVQHDPKFKNPANVPADL
jgi:hypothetical protein